MTWPVAVIFLHRTGHYQCYASSSGLSWRHIYYLPPYYRLIALQYISSIKSPPIFEARHGISFIHHVTRRIGHFSHTIKICSLKSLIFSKIINIEYMQEIYKTSIAFILFEIWFPLWIYDAAQAILEYMDSITEYRAYFAWWDDRLVVPGRDTFRNGVGWIWQ